MGADDWRYEYLSNEIREYTKRVEETGKLVKRAEQELNACQWQLDKNKAILDMLEVAYKVNVLKEPKNPDPDCNEAVIESNEKTTLQNEVEKLCQNQAEVEYSKIPERAQP